mmetsp:Transcript_8750/g.21356  ORF Transcript_8750/g.21356 Transcript_8750/m.21356 type:complete len:200 (+) Transcript_8750:192-791(+)|eukprot:CAMPEP_0197185950 /NCGR_PEP_ID=MMETSP1423-20130617/12927_1 /TAXON_ID=476441 /ORGANISM="Pseudo-nitzschia heimii, Strain UNC1101" /LENGTH=199 /DNA_ID=CAMNT_0042637131 /DNA_START=171 /DNA_END=770 /DNA_ORIENTATION=-
MVWMSLMNKKNMRRRKSQSPSSSSESSPKVENRVFFGSKYKRRILRKRDYAITEASSLSSKWSIQTDGALWRVENIRENPPTADEWWEDKSSSDTINVSREVEDDEIGHNGSTKIVIKTPASSCQKKFHNCGFETWTRARHEWKNQTVNSVPERPALVDRAQIIKGLRKATSQRTYELPRNIALSDLIQMYDDIWDGCH